MEGLLSRIGVWRRLTGLTWAANISGPAYAIDDQTAIKAVDGTVEVICEGQWKLLTS